MEQAKRSHQQKRKSSQNRVAEQEDNSSAPYSAHNKKLKRTTNTNHEDANNREGGVATTTTSNSTPNELTVISPTEERPKSKKELRKERKLAQKKTVTATNHKDAKPQHSSAMTKNNQNDNNHQNQNLKGSKEDLKEQKRQAEREEKRLERKRQKEEKERALELRFQEQDRIRREKEEAEQTQKGRQKGRQRSKHEGAQNNNKKKKKQKKEEPERDYEVLRSLFQNKVDPTTGATICRHGVQYIDEVVGTGPPVGRKSFVTVKYQLRGGSAHGLLLDSSKKFTFQLGRGEVIEGWDIGLESMKKGGARHLVVPPKAGYGSRDIGAGPGAILYFHISLLDFK